MGNIRRYMPSGRFSTIALSCLVTLGIVLGASFYPSKSSETTSVLPVDGDTLANLIRNADSTDSDNDGLRDWEEALWKTNIHNADTDGDGTSDGVEVGEGRNPLLPGPKDILENTIGTESVSEELTATDKLAREFFTEYAKSKQSGVTISSLNSQSIVASTLSRSDILSNAREYTEGEIIITKNNSDTALREYANALGSIQKTYALDPKQETELSIFEKAIQGNDRRKLEGLAPIAVRYENIVKAMLKVETPSVLSGKHLALLNDMSAIYFSVNMMRNAFIDPIGALAAVSEYIKHVSEISGDYKSIGKDFESRSITFSSDEPGYLFLNTYK